MNFLARFRVLAYLLVLLSILGFTYADHNLPLLILALLALGVSWVIVESPKGRPLPRWLINAGVLLASLALFWELVIGHQESLLVALGHFMILILLCKLFERKSNRDYAQILTLSLLLMVTGSIFSSSIFFGLMLASFLALGLYAVLLFHLRTETERALILHPNALMALPERGLRRDIRLVAYGSGGILLVFAILVFLLFPRESGRNLLGGWAMSGSESVTGFSERVGFTDLITMHESNTPVLQVRLEQNGMVLGSEFEPPYLRGMTLNLYDSAGQQWLSPPPRRPFMGARPFYFRLPSAVNDRQLVAPEDYLAPAAIKQVVTLLNPTATVLFVMPEPARVHSTQISHIHFDPGNNTLTFRSNPTNNVEYEVESFMRYRHDRIPPPDRLAIYGMIDLDQGFHPRPLPAEIVSVARKWAGELLTPEGVPVSSNAPRKIAEAFVRELHTYPYSLHSQQVERGLDPTADFLKNRQKIGGHCEYFASAMVLLCTAAQIPARMATGYHGGEFNSIGGFYVVRQRHAHAWTEVYLPGEGWTIFDATPLPPDTENSGAPAWIRWFQEVLQNIEHQWVSSIVSFDNSTRQYLNEKLLKPLLERPRQILFESGFLVRAWVELLTGPGTRLGPRLLEIVKLLLLLAGAVFTLVYRIRCVRDRPLVQVLKKIERTRRSRLVKDLAFYDEYIRLLEKAGVKRQLAQTTGEMARLACQNVPAIATDATCLLNLFYEIRFGDLKPTERDRVKMTNSLKNMRHQLSASVA